MSLGRQMYRSILRSLRLVRNKADRVKYIEEAKSEFRRNRHLDGEELDTALAGLSSKISFLHIKHPETKSECPQFDEKHAVAASQEASSGIKRRYYSKGEVTDATSRDKKAKNFRNWIDPDDIKKHHQLIERQHFSGPYWKGQGGPYG